MTISSSSLTACLSHVRQASARTNGVSPTAMKQGWDATSESSQSVRLACTLTQLAHCQPYVTRLVGTDEEMHVISHQTIGMDPQAMGRAALSQRTEIVLAVVVIQRDGATIDFALRDMERYSGYFQASLAWHGRRRWPKQVGCPGLRRHAASAVRDGAGRREPDFQVA